MSTQLKQGTQAWLDSRIGRITGSRVGAVLGASPFSNREDVMREMVREHFGAEREFKGNIATEWGNYNEDKAIAQYESETGALVISTGFHALCERFGASPDGLIGIDGMIEVKCPYSKKIKPLSEQPHYADQIQMEMLCADREWCDFVTWTPSKMQIERVRRDIMWFARNIEKLADFFAEYIAIIESDETAAPHLDPIISERDDQEWTDASESYKEAKEALERAKEIESEAKTRLIELSSGRKSHGNSVLVYPVAGRKSVKYQDALKKFAPDADLEEFTKQGAESWSVKIDKNE